MDGAVVQVAGGGLTWLLQIWQGSGGFREWTAEWHKERNGKATLTVNVGVSAG